MNPRKPAKKAKPAAKAKPKATLKGDNTKFVKKMSTSSKEYLKRQSNDPYVRQAKADGYASRAAFKILEIHAKTPIFKKGQCIVDLGAAPGGWTQVAVQHGCRVVACDILPVISLPEVTFIHGDFTTEDVWNAVKRAVPVGGADAVISDMAPNTSGHMATDHLRSMGLAELARDSAFELLKKGGHFVTKIFMGGEEKAFSETLRPRFTKVAFIKPPASRVDSREIFIVATGFKG
ncbi:MAG: RlmE family RNA methyltransferase [Alphaproteobacteria bacterium]